MLLGQRRKDSELGRTDLEEDVLEVLAAGKAVPVGDWVAFESEAQVDATT